MDRIRLLAPLLDGSREWGCLQVKPGRWGATYYHLVVYPPGLSVPERRLVRLARGWPLWGMLLWLLCQLWLIGEISPWAAFGVSTAVFVATGLVALGLSGGAYHRVQTLCVTVLVGDDDPQSRMARNRLIALAAILLRADEDRDRGEITRVDHELIWWEVYNDLQTNGNAEARQAG
ncbi:hypothetical protein A5733_19515 [Mycobacterium sp. NS-7484]|uniref:DUF6611 family protein n=1 Tax=Mycobacterium sp. NS-7484 TaxID=1834161 RepID=UPI00096EA268|nr:DUF6611 family protein [Mycobacterium sp. NS-7484]OMC05571.1 hypothetical protein A5733_19515 [Mycobacterium sp. NS-7484]